MNDPPPPSHANVVELRRTPVTRDALRASLGRAWETLHGAPANPRTLDLLTAQSSLETGNGQRMYNFNFGGIKGRSADGDTARARTHEWEDGHRVETRAYFRAYDSLDEGAVDYLSLLQRRYGDALDAAGRGDPDGFVHALKRHGYFTGPELGYVNTVRRLLGMPSRHDLPEDVKAPEGGPTPASTFGTALAVARVLDAVSAGAARIAAPDKEGDTASSDF